MNTGAPARARRAVSLALLAGGVALASTAVAQSASRPPNVVKPGEDPFGGAKGRPPAATPIPPLPGGSVPKPATPPTPAAKPATTTAARPAAAVVLGPVPADASDTDKVLQAAADALGDIGLPAAKDAGAVRVSTSARVNYQIVQKRCDTTGSCTVIAKHSSGTGQATIDYGSSVEVAPYGLLRVVFAPIPGGIYLDEPPDFPEGFVVEADAPPLKVGDAQRRFLGRFTLELKAWCANSSNKASSDYSAICVPVAAVRPESGGGGGSSPSIDYTEKPGALIAVSLGGFRTWTDSETVGKSELKHYEHTTGLRMNIGAWGSGIALGVPLELGISSPGGTWYRTGLSIGRSTNFGPLFLAARTGLLVSGDTKNVPFGVEIPVTIDLAVHLASTTLITWYETSTIFGSEKRRMNGSDQALWGDQSSFGVEAFALGGSKWGLGYEARKMMGTTNNIIFVSYSLSKSE